MRATQASLETTPLILPGKKKPKKKAAIKAKVEKTEPVVLVQE